jgi:hypothetical protein
MNDEDQEGGDIEETSSKEDGGLRSLDDNGTLLQVEFNQLNPT